MEILRDECYAVIEAEDGYQAIEAEISESIDLVLMDIVMPGINGVQTFREIKQIASGMPVIMITGSAGNDLTELAIEEGAMSVITKPIEVADVVNLAHLASSNSHQLRHRVG